MVYPSRSNRCTHLISAVLCAGQTRPCFVHLRKIDPIIGTPNDIYSFGSVMLEVTIFSAPMFPAINISYRYYQAECHIITFGPMLKLLSNCTRALNRGGLLPLSWMKINGILFKNAGKTRLRIGHLYLRLWN